jgi:dipeptidase E
MSIHDVSNMPRTIDEADAIFVGGGNTFRLLKGLYNYDLLSPIRRRVAAGVPYIGSSAGSIVACPSLKTTKDMPVVQPPSFEALCLVPSRSVHIISILILHPRIWAKPRRSGSCSLEENDQPVVGLREGSILRIQDATITLKGPNAARVFRRGEDPCEVEPDSDLSTILGELPQLVGARA